jgi:hypothetical protein
LGLKQRAEFKSEFDNRCEVLVERYGRDEENWIYFALDHLEATLALTSIDCDVPLKEIHAKVGFQNKLRTMIDPFMSVTQDAEK